jgi:predicted molibdopterin-dependent oxidoreductase YjgC
VLGTKHIDFRRHSVEGDDDALLIRADKTPNSLGAQEAGVQPRDGGLAFDGILRDIREGRIKAAYLLDDNLASDPEVVQVLTRLEFLVVHSSTENETTRLADVVLPSATFAERHGTFTNFQGRVQRIRPSVATLEVDRALEGFAMSRLDKFGSSFDRWARGTKRDARPSWRIVAGVASLMGFKYRYATVEDVFTDLASSVESFRGLTYAKIGSKGAALKLKQPAGTAAMV